MEKPGVERLKLPVNYVVKHTETGECIDICSPDYARYDEVGLEGIYEHYKSTPEAPKLYEVEQVVEHIPTGEVLVIYVPLYETEETKPSARPYSMFVEEAAVDGITKPRFRLVRRQVS